MQSCADYPLFTSICHGNFTSPSIHSKNNLTTQSRAVAKPVHKTNGWTAGDSGGLDDDVDDEDERKEEDSYQDLGELHLAELGQIDLLDTGEARRGIELSKRYSSDETKELLQSQEVSHVAAVGGRRRVTFLNDGRTQTLEQEVQETLPIKMKLERKKVRSTFRLFPSKGIEDGEHK